MLALHGSFDLFSSLEYVTNTASTGWFVPK